MSGPAKAAATAALAVAVFALAYGATVHLSSLIAAVVGVALVVAVTRYPAPATMALLTALPFDLYGMAALYRVGVPASILRPARFWPEAIVAGLAVTALYRHVRRHGRLDGLDLAAIAYAGLGSVYLLVPRLFVGAGPGSAIGLYARELGWRSDVLYVAVLVFARRLPFSRGETTAMMDRVVRVGLVVAALGLFEFADSGAWNHFATAIVQVPRYQSDVLHALPPGTSDTEVRIFGTVAGHTFVRVGSVLDYESLAFYLAICAGLAADGFTRRREGRRFPLGVLVLALGIVVTQTRAALLGGAVAIGLALLPAGARLPSRQRTLRHLMVGFAAAVALAALFGGVGSRLTGDRSSDSAHVSSTTSAIKLLLAHPGGQGLATAAGGGQVAALKGLSAGFVIAEDQWLQIGIQLGVAGLGLYALTCLLAVRGLGPLRRMQEAAPAATRAALVGCLIGGTFLQPFTEDAVSLTLFVLIGVALGPPDADVGSPADPAATVSRR